MSFIAKKLQEMDKRDNLDWRIIRRKVEGKLTVEEERQLREWIGRDLRRQAFIKSVEKYYAAEDLPVVLPEQVDNAWQRFSCFCASCREIFLS